MGPALNVMDVPENLWKAVTLARNIRLHHEKQAAIKAQNGGVAPVGGVNVDAL